TTSSGPRLTTGYHAPRRRGQRTTTAARRAHRPVGDDPSRLSGPTVNSPISEERRRLHIPHAPHDANLHAGRQGARADPTATSGTAPPPELEGSDSRRIP